ncbi:sulfate/thiosulfate-binding protein [Opitutaceae bacterium TAV1]|nr:sulfate/thiosulfate-binding protein [Opitutaceae bacterium TAV1]
MKRTRRHLCRALAALLFAFPFASLRAQFTSPGCCGGGGDFGVNGQWKQIDVSNVPKKDRVVSIHNASFGTTRDLFAEINREFGKEWVKKTSYSLTVNGTHGSTFAQTRALLEGGDSAEADLVTLDHPGAIDILAAPGNLLPADWRSRLPNDSVPFSTTVVFLVRKGNPKAIRDWSDLVKPGVSVITPDPRRDSVGQWIWLAAWASALRQTGNDEAAARARVLDLYRQVPVLNSTSAGSLATFAEKSTGDVLLVLESEARARLRASGGSRFEIVTPPASLRVDLPVAWLDRNVDKHGTTRVTASYLIWLFDPKAQEIAVRHHYRPSDRDIARKHAGSFPSLEIVSVDDAFGGWSAVRERFLSSGGILERDYPALNTREVVSRN